MKFLSFATTLLLISACETTQSQQQFSPTYAAIPTRILIPIPMASLAPEVPSSSSTSPTEPPAWVTNFADPILARIAGQYTAFHDDFTAQLNHGWFYLVPNSRKQIYYAHLEEDSLILRIPDGSERKDATVYSPKLAYKNFVLSLDFKFGKTEPNDLFRLQFKQAESQSVVVDLSKNETSAINVNLHNDVQSSDGVYEYFGPEFINVILIMNDAECAVYINQTPFAYLNNCRATPIGQPALSAVSFHLLSTTGHPAIVTIDNVELWDLDKINFVSP